MLFSNSLMRRLAVALALVAYGATPALAQPNQTRTEIINEDDGFPGVCAAPCYSVEKVSDVYLDGNNTGPIACAAGENLFVYTLTHIGGTLPAPNIPITEFEMGAPFNQVMSAGFIPGADVAPTSTNISALNVVSWAFPTGDLAGNCSAGPGNCLSEGNSSEQLFICATGGVGSQPDNASTTAIVLDAPGECLGPIVADCTLEIDKTCCIPTPPSPGVDQCEGKVVRLVLEYTGDECTATTNTQEGKAKCTGAAPGDPVDVVITKDEDKISASPDMNIGLFDNFVITSTEGELKASTKFEVTGPDGTQELTIHTSCSKALGCGDQFGSMKVVELETTEGGTIVCTPPDPEGTQCTLPQGQLGVECDERPVEIVFEYTGSDCQNPLPQDPDKAECSGDPAGAEPVNVTYTGKDPGKFTLSPSSDIDVGETFAFTATGRDELHSESKFLIDDGVGIVQSLRFHTSCSQPLACGDEFGALKIVEFTQKDGVVVSCDTDPGPLFQDACEVPLAPPTPHCTSKIMELQLAYIGDELGFGCSVTNSQGGNASCTGVDDPGSPVSITVTKDPDKIFADPDSGILAPTMMNVDIVSFTNQEDFPNAKELKSTTEFDVTGPGGTQSIEIHTSCSKPLNLGDVFGSFAVVGIERKDDGFVGLGGQVEYQYKVTNNSAEDAIVDVVDDPFGPVASGETIAGNGGMETFFVTKTLFSTLTNTATASGTTTPSGGICNEPTDDVTVTVSLPPQGAFDCSDAKPIDQLTMEWSGLNDICVRAYDGDPGETLLDEIDNVMQGDLVEVSGMGGSPNDQEWEIYAAGDCGGTLLGTSAFHISCSDDNMNGIEDCGKNEGNGKNDDPALVDDWLLEGMKGDETLNCTPDPIGLPGPSFGCGIGFEAALLLPGLMWLRRRRRR